MTDKANDPIEQVEVQSATLGGAPTGGTFTLSGNGRTTAPIAFNASAAAVQAVLQSLWDDRGGNAMTDKAMTRAAGRELDALVAERVMGYTVWNDLWLDKNGDALMPIPYSTNIAAAWQVVERLTGDKGYCLEGMYRENPSTWGCNATLAQVRGGIIINSTAWAATAPLAICLAAIGSVEA